MNILSADIYTRPDGIVLDLFRVCTKDFKAEENRSRQKAVVKTLYGINESDNYDSSIYLKKKVNYLNPETEQVIKFPTRAWISNELDPHFTVIELQALDRIGLLHDVFKTVNTFGFKTVHCRICTEKGAALDSIFICTDDEQKVTDQPSLEKLKGELNALLEG